MTSDKETFDKRKADKDFRRKPVQGDVSPRKGKPTRSPLRQTSAFEGERIAKVMARVGLCSRRDAEEWVRAGRVAVNGKAIGDPALNITESDEVTIDGKPLAGRDKTKLFLFNKPRGLVTTDHDPEGRPTVFAYLAHHHPELPRLISVGRLDLTSEGLLLLTNDGGLARVLELPATGWLRRYRVRAHGQTTPDAVAALKTGVTIDGVAYQPIDATLDRVQGANTWLTVTLREGKNREVRRVLEHLGLEVNRLIRLSYGPFQLGDAPDGAVEEVRTRVLMDQLGPALIAEARADFSTLRKEEERAHQSARDASVTPPKRERPVAGKRKHVSALRQEKPHRDAKERVRTERGETADRRGRTVSVERKTAARPREEDAESRNGRRFRDERAPPATGARDRAGARFEGARPAGARPAGARSAGAKTTGGRPAQQKPGGKTFGERASGGRSSNSRPNDGTPHDRQNIRLPSNRTPGSRPPSSRPPGGRPPGGRPPGGRPPKR